MTTQDTERRLALVKSATSGVLDDLECPSCRRKSVTVRFTHPFGSQYRTWFLCRSCDFTMRAQNSGVPAHFSQNRVDRDLEARDRDGVAPKDRPTGCARQRRLENVRLTRVWRRTRRECNAALALLPRERPILKPGEIGTVEQYAAYADENEWEVAIGCLARIGAGVSVPPAFWRHLLAAAELVGLDKEAALFRARLSG